MLKPAALSPGDLIGVVAPGAVVDDKRIRAGVALLEDAGFRVRLGDSVFRRHGYLAGRDEERLADLTAMLVDGGVRAIFAARGGYGCGRLLPDLDVELLRRHPKILVGYSDLTFLLARAVQEAELVVFHGPMVADLADRERAARRMLALLVGDHTDWNLSAQGIVQPGTAEGRIAGGCLSVVVSMLGTPYEMDTKGRLLFLEDVNEKPYRIDRMLTQLRQAGKFDEVAGVLFGEMHDCTAGPDEAMTVEDVIGDAFAGASHPVVFGLPTGHGSASATLPLGVRARLAGERLTLLEPVLGG